MEWVNLEKVQKIRGFVLDVFRAIDRASSRTMEDQAQFEGRMIEQALGSRSLTTLQQLGLPPLRSRADLDQLAMVLSQSLVV